MLHGQDAKAGALPLPHAQGGTVETVLAEGGKWRGLPGYIGDLVARLVGGADEADTREIIQLISKIHQPAQLACFIANRLAVARWLRKAALALKEASGQVVFQGTHGRATSEGRLKRAKAAAVKHGLNRDRCSRFRA